MAVSFPMPNTIPVPYPDFTVCDKVYGENLLVDDCMRAASLLPAGTVQVRYPLNFGTARGLVRAYG